MIVIKNNNEISNPSEKDAPKGSLIYWFTN